MHRIPVNIGYLCSKKTSRSFERDRRAILAMQGGYKVAFDFLETVGFESDFERDRPYQSWGTEYVYVVEDDDDFISLQHVMVMVMVFQNEDGTLSDPMVMKHWRQDWKYQDTELLEYQHKELWRLTNLSREDVKGTWTQSVFQVDDSPRYESIGQWEHNASFSQWKSAKTRRPLPRREYSVRNDYDLLEGFNSHVITQHGWTQVEENWKAKVDETGRLNDELPYLSKEQGIARYLPIVGFDFSAGDQYMQSSGEFWSDVRSIWNDELGKDNQVRVSRRIDGQPLFFALFDYASKIESAEKYDSKAGKAFALRHIKKHINQENK